MAEDVATVSEYCEAGGELFGLTWANWTRDRGWHPRWAAEVSRRYGQWLASTTCQDPEHARQQALGRWTAHLAMLRAQDLNGKGGIAAAIGEALRQIDALQGAPERPKAPAVSVTFTQVVGQGGRIDSRALASMSDAQLAEKLAELVAVRDGEDEAAAADGAAAAGGAGGEGVGGDIPPKGTHLGSHTQDTVRAETSPLVPQSPSVALTPAERALLQEAVSKPIKPLERSPMAQKSEPTAQVPLQGERKADATPGGSQKMGPLSKASSVPSAGGEKRPICAGCGVVIREGFTVVRDKKNIAWHERCFDRYER